MDYSFFETLYLIITIVFLFLYFFIDKKYGHTLRNKLLISYLFGFLYTLFNSSWFWSVYPLPWFPSGFKQIISILIVHVITSLIAGIPFILSGYVLWKLRNKNTYFHLAFLPIAFSFIEILRSLILSIMHLGKGGEVSISWTIGALGEPLASTPLVELAYFGGVYFLTWGIVQIIYGLFLIKNKYSILFVLLPLIFTLMIHFFAPIGGPKDNVRVLAITTNFKTLNSNDWQKEFESRNKKIKDVILANKNESPDLILLPEDSRFISYSSQESLDNLKKYFANAVILDGSTLPFGSSIRNYTLFYDLASDTTVGRGKTFLAPYNEYMPYIFLLPFKLLIGEESYKNYLKNHTYSEDKKILTYAAPFGRISSLICSEMMSFYTIFRVQKENPDIIVLQSYLSIFHNNPLFLIHHVFLSKILAAQLRKPTIIIANEGLSLYLSPEGRVIQDLTGKEEVSGTILSVDKESK